jgi:hypothetical protein
MMRYSILFNPVILVMKLLLGGGAPPAAAPRPIYTYIRSTATRSLVKRGKRIHRNPSRNIKGY